jgi:hypothetical protein
MSIRAKAVSLTVAALLVLALLAGTPVTARSPASPPTEDAWPQVHQGPGAGATTVCGSVTTDGPSAADRPVQPEPGNRQKTTVPVFFDDMEGDVSDWTATGFWHQVANPQIISVYHAGAASPEDPPNDVNPDLVTLPDTNDSGRAYLGSAYSGSHVFWYGVDNYGCFIDPAGTFDPATQSAKNGGASSTANSGSLVSPAIDLTGLAAASLYFWTWWEIEGTDADDFDMMYVEISTDGGASFTTVGTLNPLNDVNNEHHENYSSGGSKATPVWVHSAFDIGSYAGNVIKLRFRFETVDSDYNGFRGWMIDDVMIEPAGLPAPQIFGVDPGCVQVANLGTKIVTISGANFVNGASVTVGGQPAASVSVASPAEIQILLPATLASGTYSVTVTNPDGQGATLLNAIVVSDAPCPAEVCPGATIRSVRSGDWADPNTWDLGRVPNQDDVVLIRTGHTVVGREKAIIKSLCNYGVLQSRENRSLEIIYDQFILNGGTIEGKTGGRNHAGSSIKLSGGLFTGGSVTNNGTIRAGDGGTGDFSGDQGGSISIWGSKIVNAGTIQAGAGADGTGRGGPGGAVNLWGGSIENKANGTIDGGSGGKGGRYGGNGGSVKLKGYPVDNAGTIRGGKGGGGDKYGGHGGAVHLLGRDTTNTGDILGGKGGNVLGTGKGRAGNGGKVTIWGKWWEFLLGFLKNLGKIFGGDGGDGNPAATSPQKGGKGGKTTLLAEPSAHVGNGKQRGGRGGQGTGGGADGPDGRLIVEPSTISLAGGETEVSGSDVLIFGGDDWILDLSNLSAGAVVATDNITIAVGTGGVVDLRENSSQVLQAGDRVFIASDEILLDAGVGLADVAGDNAVTGPSQILYDFSLFDPGSTVGQPGATVPVSLTFTNNGPVADTYTLSVSDAAGWDTGGLPSSVTVEGLDICDLALDVTVPSNAVAADSDVVTVTATSHANANLVEVATFWVSVDEKETMVYLPLVLRNYSPPPLYFDDFSDPGSGWPTSDTTDYALDYDSGNYRVQIKEDDRFVWVSPQSLTFDGCTVEVEAWRSTGGNSSYGIVFGLDASAGKFYAFIVQPYNQQYALSRRDGDSWVTLIPYTGSSHVNFNMAHNRFRVTRDGSQIRLYVNDHYLASYTDSTYTGTRRVGIYASSGSESPIWLRYDDFTVWGPGYGMASSTTGRSGEVGVMTVPSDWAVADRTGRRADGD